MKHFKNTNNEIFAYDDKQVAQGYGATLEPLTDAELAALKDSQEQERLKNADTEKANKKASGKQKLKDLGLDDDEINALMGA
jgi:hypothetical protein